VSDPSSDTAISDVFPAVSAPIWNKPAQDLGQRPFQWAYGTSAIDHSAG